LISLYRSNIGAFCADVDLTSERPVVDLSNVGWIDPFPLIYLGLFLRYHNKRGKYFKVRKAPYGHGISNYLARMRFCERFNFSAEAIKRERLHHLESSTSLNDVVDIESSEDVGEEVARLVVEVLLEAGHSVRGGHAALDVIVDELVDNFARHSQESLAAFMMQWFPSKRYVSLALGDCGLGMKSTLLRNSDYEHLAESCDAEAITLSLQPLVSCRGSALGGTGLTDVKETVLACGGSLFLASGSDYAMIQGDQIRTGHMGFTLPGVQLEARLPTV
jgi:hypothetical protein